MTSPYKDIRTDFFKSYFEKAKQFMLKMAMCINPLVVTKWFEHHRRTYEGIITMSAAIHIRYGILMAQNKRKRGTGYTKEGQKWVDRDNVITSGHVQAMTRILYDLYEQ